MAEIEGAPAAAQPVLAAPAVPALGLQEPCTLKGLSRYGGPPARPCCENRRPIRCSRAA
jgi:hypothetical protein